MRKLILLTLLTLSACETQASPPPPYQSDSGAWYPAFCDDLDISDRATAEFTAQQAHFNVPVNKKGEGDFKVWSKRDHLVTEELIDRIERQYNCVFL